MSRPTTPHGISPRGSYVNLLEGREEGAFSPSKIEKERLRAEAEVKASLLKEKDSEKSARKEEPTVPVGSSGMYIVQVHTSLVSWYTRQGDGDLL